MSATLLHVDPSRIPKHQLWAWEKGVEDSLKEAARDKSPLKNLAEPGAMAALRQRLGVTPSK